jgi:hypothetical protein
MQDIIDRMHEKGTKKQKQVHVKEKFLYLKGQEAGWRETHTKKKIVTNSPQKIPAPLRKSTCNVEKNELEAQHKPHTKGTHFYLTFLTF